MTAVALLLCLLACLLLFPTPAAEPASVVGTWDVRLQGWTGRATFAADGSYAAWNDSGTVWVGTWAESRGVLTVRERGMNCHGATGWRAMEFRGVRVTGGDIRSACGGVSGTRVVED